MNAKVMTEGGSSVAEIAELVGDKHQLKPVPIPERNAAYALVPDATRLEEIRLGDRPPPDRINAVVRLEDHESLIAYISRFKRPESVIFANIDSRVITAEIDYHHRSDNTDTASCREHRVELPMQFSREFDRWNKFQGDLHPQMEFARFLEENHTDVVHPDGSSLLDLCMDLEGAQDGSWKAKGRLDNGDRALEFSVESRVTNQAAIPAELILNLPIFTRSDPARLIARFRWRVRDGALFLGVEWHRVEFEIEAEFRAIVGLVAEQTGLVALYGSAGR